MSEPTSMISLVISQVSHRFLKGTSKDDSLYWETDSDGPVSVRSV